jgi:hypothetical protein
MYGLLAHTWAIRNQSAVKKIERAELGFGVHGHDSKVTPEGTGVLRVPERARTSFNAETLRRNENK